MIEATYAYIAENALAALQWALAMLKEYPVIGAICWIAPVTILAIIVDVALEWITKKVIR